MASIMSKPQLIRNVAIVGGLHHGKTLLSDMILEATYTEKPKISNTSKDQKYTDCRIDEIDRKISIKAAPF